MDELHPEAQSKVVLQSFVDELCHEAQSKVD